jgi:hypothetical protein
MSYGTPYIDLPAKQYKIITQKLGGKDSKMSNINKSTNETKPAKVYNKTRGEHFKDMLIVALIVGIASFIGGMYFANQHSAEIKNAVSAAQVATPVTAKK